MRGASGETAVLQLLASRDYGRQPADAADAGAARGCSRHAHDVQ